MAPFMMIGRKLRNSGKWPSLELRALWEKCGNCLTCNENCPMSINVHANILRGEMEHADCILCGQCVDNCERRVIAYSFGKKK